MASDKLTELAKRKKAKLEPEGEPGELPMSPARKRPGGKIRFLSRMGVAKFEALIEEMKGYEERDPEAFEAVAKEAESRGYVIDEEEK